MLVNMSYLHRVALKTSGRGRPQSPSFEVNPLARTQNTQNPQKPPDDGNSEDSEDSVYTSAGHGESDEDVGEV